MMKKTENRPSTVLQEVRQSPPEKEKAIEDALFFYNICIKEDYIVPGII